MNLNDFRQKIPQLARLDDQSALDLLHKHYYPDVDKQRMADVLGVKAPPPPPVPERSALRAAGDLGLQFGGGVVSGVRMMTDLAGANNQVSAGLRSAEDALRELQSATAKADQQRIAEIMKEAENKGFADQVVAGVKAFGQAPAAMIAQALGTSVPTLATALIPGAVPARLGAAAKAGITATQRTALGAGIGAAQGGGAIKGAIYDEVMQNPLPGETPEQTAERATKAQAYDGPNTDQIAMGAALGGVAGSTGMERAAAALRGGVTDAPKNLMARMALGAGTEALPEAAQGGQEKFATNTALVREGVDVDPWSGVVAGGTMEALAGGVTGGLFGIPAPNVRPDADPKAAGDAVRGGKLPVTGPMTKAVNAGTEMQAQQAEADAAARTTSLSGTTMADLLGRGAVDPLAEKLAADRQSQDDKAQFLERNQTMLAGGDMAASLAGTRSDPVAGMLAVNRDSEANSIANILQAGDSRPPMQAGDAARILQEAKFRGLDYVPAPHPAGGYVVVPRRWVQPSVADKAAADIEDAMVRMRQAEDQPVVRADRRRTDAADISLDTDAVGGYINELRNTNTPAARAYVGEFDAGRVTRADVEQRMQIERGKSPDQRLAEAAAEGLKLNNKGDPFKTLFAAQRAAKTTPGTVIEVPGGFAIQTKETAGEQAKTTPAGQAEQMAGAALPTAAIEPAAGATAADADGVKNPLGAVDVQDQSQATTGAPVTAKAATTGDQTKAVEETAPARGDGAAATGVSAAGGSGDVQANGVTDPADAKDMADHEAARQRFNNRAPRIKAARERGDTSEVERLNEESRKDDAIMRTAMAKVSKRSIERASSEWVSKETAYFGTKEKADDFIAKSGIKDTHEVVQAKPGRFEIRAKAGSGMQTADAATTERTNDVPDWWKNKTPAERVWTLKASGVKGTAVTPWARISPADQKKLNDQWGPKDEAPALQSLEQQLFVAKNELENQGPVATHQDPGEKPEVATKDVVSDSLKTAAKNEGAKPSEMRKWLVGEIDKALLDAPDRADYDEAVKRMGEKDAISMFTGSGFLGKNAETGFITFDVPGDGKFKVRNSMRGLLEFKKRVAGSPGFKDSGQRQLPPAKNNGVENGSGGLMAAITNMIEEGDFEAARDYAEAVGVDLADVKVPKGERKPQWDAFLKDGTLPPPPNTKPLPPQKTAAQIDEEKREAAAAEAKKPSDTGWNMAGTGYGGKRYRGRNITLEDGREVVARIYESAGRYNEVEIKVNGVRKFTVVDEYNAQDKADAFIGTLAADSTSTADQTTEPKQEKGRMTAIPVPASTVAWMGLDGAKSVQADLQALAERHPEYYDDAQAVRKDIDFVLGKPDGWYIHKDRRVVLFRERVGEGAIPQARVEIEADADTMRVRSVYVGGKRQIAKKMADKRKELSGLGLGGQSPDSLTIAEYLEALGDGSSRPAAPSGAVPEAAPSVPQPAQEVQPDTPKLTPAEVQELMEWQDLGQKNGVKTHILTFYESKADKEAKRGRMIVATLSKEVDSKSWVLESNGEKYAMLGFAKKRAEAAGMARAMADGFVGPENDNPNEAAAVQNSAAPAAQSATVENFGEKLPPARRAIAAKLSEDLTDDKIASLPLSQIWPVAENEAIEDVATAAAAHVMRDAIPAKPRVAYKVKSWVGKVKFLREFAAKVVRGDIGRNKVMEEMQKIYALRDLATKIKLLEQIDRAQWKRIGDVSEAPNAVRYEGGIAIPVPSVSVTVDGKNHWLRGSGDVLTHLDAIKAMLGADAPDSKMQFEIRQETKGERKVFINKKGDKEYRRLMEFATVEEARKAIKDQYAELVAAWDGVKDRDNITERDLRSDTNRERAGKDHRKGRDVTAEEFESKFGFRGGEFGKWVGQGKGAQERQFMLNSAYDALMDLSDLLGIPPKAISLEGSLGIAFGSRGSGWASAHFEPSNLVINLTKTRGAGALAHEWFHALDNYFARKRGGEVPFDGNNNAYRRNNYVTYKTTPLMVRKDGRGTPVSKERLAEWRKSSQNAGYLAEDQWMEDPNHRQGVRAEVEQAFSDLVKALNDSPMLKRAQTLDGVGRNSESDGYWSRVIERAARAFENYVQTRMMEQGYHNDFLANVKAADEVGKNVDRYPYLLPSEIAPVAEAFQTLFGTVQTKETEDGNVAMFSRSKATQSAYETRIDALFSGDKASRTGVTILDSSDVMGLLGYSGVPLVLNEAHIAGDGQTNHPEMTASIWKRIPDWIENPAAVYTDPKHPGKLTVVAPTKVAGYPVVIAIEPDIQRGKPDHLLVTAFAKTTGNLPPVGPLATSGRLLYADTKKAPEIWSGIGDNPRPTRLIAGAKRILTEKNLFGYRKSVGADFSRTAGGPESNALKALSENDALFQLPKSTETEVEAIAAEHDPGIQVKKVTNIPGETRFNFTLPISGKTARMVLRRANPFGQSTYGFRQEDGEISEVLTERPGRDAENVPPEAGDVWIDVSLLESGDEGRMIYNIASTYAHNNGHVFIGDPAGLSDEAMRRRPEQMLSSALKWGTTQHLAPHPRQVDGDRKLGIPPLDWRYGDDIHNIYELIRVNLANLENAGADGIDFDPGTGQFLDQDGNPLDRADLAILAEASYGRRAGAGASTLARASVLRALSREAGGQARGGDGRPNDLLARVLRQSAVHPQATNGLFYSLNQGRAKPGSIPVAAAQKVVDNIKSRWANAPDVVVVSSMQDAKVPQRVREEDLKQRSQGATGEPEGFWYGNKVYIVAGALGAPTDVARVLFHEALGHYGLRGLFGEGLTPILKQLAALRRKDVAEMADRYGLDVNVEAEKLQAAEEVLAFMAQETPNIGYVKRALAVVKAWLRKHFPGFLSMKLTDADIIAQYILPARRFVEQGGPGGGDFKVAFARSSDSAIEEFAETEARIGGAEAYIEAFNARTTVLPYRQWVQVRTPSFKKWWGYDWENVGGRDAGDGGGAGQSARVGAAPGVAGVGKSAAEDSPTNAFGPNQRDAGFYDERTGEPRVFRHGTKDDFTVFDVTHPNKKDHGWLGAGHYFTSDAWLADHYSRIKKGDGGPRVMDVFVRPNNPRVFSMAEKLRVARYSKDGVGILTQRMKDAGHGGSILTFEDGTVEVMTFDANGIKSASHNNGDFDPANPDIRFSRTSPIGIQETIRAFDVKTAPKNTWAHYRGMAMQALGRRQIVDLYAEELPQLERYDDLVQQMDAEKNDTGAEADKLVQNWGNLKDEKQLAELMHDATLAQIDPAKPMEPGVLQAQYRELKARFDALTPEAQALYRRARDMYDGHYRKVQQAIKERIERTEMSSGQKRQIMARMDEELFKKLKGVYFPLARFGDYVIVVKDANGEVKNATRAEGINEAEEARKELHKAFPKHMGYTVGKVLKQAEFNAGRDAVGKGFMADLMNALDAKGIDDELRDTVAQLYLSSLPDLSWAKHGLHRKGTPGFSQDARRAFAQNMFHGARYLAKLRHADQLQDLLIEMQDHVRSYEGVDEYDSIAAQQVVDEMVKRYELMMNPKTSSLSTALTSFGFVFHLGLSPASAMVNMSQTALVAYPMMGAKWGWAKASAALLAASKDVVKAKNDLGTILKGAELDAYERAVKDGTIDVTMAHDLAGISQGEDQKVMWRIRPVMRAASFMFHHAERFNRQATFIAAWRMAKEAGPEKTADQLYEEAKKLTYDSHFDYAASNRPRLMQGNWQRVIFLFKQYAQAMVYTLSRNAYLSMKGASPADRKMARKTLGGILAAHAAAAGVLGLPIVGPLLTAASFIGSDDDEPWDAEVAMQNLMADMVGPKAAEVMARGFSRLTPFDLSGRVALNKLILPDVQEGLEGKQWAESAMAAALGPVAGIGVNWARGFQKITEGHYMMGLEDMMPTAIRAPLRAMRYQMEGAVDKTGVVVVDDVGAGSIVGQALGFSPSEVRRATERKAAIMDYDRSLADRRSALVRQWAEAQMNGDTDGVKDVMAEIQGFNKKNPDRKITMPNLIQSVRARRRRIEQAEDGVYLPKSREGAREAVQF